MIRSVAVHQYQNCKHFIKLCSVGSIETRHQICCSKKQLSLQVLPVFTNTCHHFCSTDVSILQETTRDDSVSPSQMYDKAIDFKSITNGDEELERKLRILCLEHEVFRQEGTLVPRSLNHDQWKHLVTLNSRSKRRKYYKFLFGNEMKKENEKLKKKQKSKERLERFKETQAEDDNDHIKYGLGQNSIMLRVYDTTINHAYNYNLIRAMQFGQKLVIDCDYDKYMTPHEAANCAKQLMIGFSENRLNNQPFDLHLCNAHPEAPTIRHLQKFIPTLYEETFPLNVTPQSYLDLFPKQDIVYLTPHCREELTKFDHNTVYIVGAMVDKSNQEPLSLAKAKREGLQMAKLPLDRYLSWAGGSGKSLTINQMVQILSEVSITEDWEKAFKYVPRRKILDDQAFVSHPEDYRKKRPFQSNLEAHDNWRRLKRRF